MKIVKNLTAKNIIGTLITRREDLDFEDDGSNFRGFEYKGLPLAVSKWNRQIFLSIRVDYLELGSKRGLLEIKFPYSV